MADNNEDKLYIDETDEDLLTTIRRWTEKAQRENEAKRGQWPPEATGLGNPTRMQNPWAPELTAAADRALQEDPQGGLPTLPAGPAQPARQVQQARPVYDQRAKANPMQKKHPVRRALVCLLALALLLGAGGYVLAFSLAGKVDRQPIADADRSALFAVTGTTRVTNILLMGMDTEDGGRSDTMLLLSVDRVHRKLKLTSILRDSWLQLPNGKSNKINTAVFFGGPAMAMRAVSENFNVRVDHYAAFSFDVFEKLVDALGGVAVPITDKEADFLCRTTRLGRQIGREEMRRQMDRGGAVKLTGEQALIFCRIRKLDDDFQRTRRQRLFFERLVNACKRNPLRLLGLLGDVLSYVQTDMTQAQMANLAAMAPLLLGYGMEEFTVPAKGTYQYGTRQGMSVITLDVAENAKRLREFIYEK